jgi:hypothetical protein
VRGCLVQRPWSTAGQAAFASIGGSTWVRFPERSASADRLWPELLASLKSEARLGEARDAGEDATVPRVAIPRVAG